MSETDERQINPPVSDREARAKAYWRANIRLMLILLAIWALVSLGFGVLLREDLDVISIGGAPLGFWFAQQGAIYVFVALIFVYCFLMSAIERRFGVSDADDALGDGASPHDATE